MITIHRKLKLPTTEQVGIIGALSQLAESEQALEYMQRHFHSAKVRLERTCAESGHHYVVDDLGEVECLVCKHVAGRSCPKSPTKLCEMIYDDADDDNYRESPYCKHCGKTGQTLVNLK